MPENLGKGIQAGRNTASSHILLDHRDTRGVSAHQYSIVIDDDMRIRLHDHYSTLGLQSPAMSRMQPRDR